MPEEPEIKRTIEEELDFIEKLDLERLKFELSQELGPLDAKIVEAEALPKAIPPQLKVRISENRMEAYLKVIHPGKPRAIGFNSLCEYLKANKVVEGIIQENLEKIVDLQVYDQEVLVAQGKLPVNGRDAVIRIITRETDTEECMDVRGRVDFKKMRLKNVINQGEVVAVKTPATPGEKGYKVTGEEISHKPGKDLDFRKSPDVAVSEKNPLQLVALKSGFLNPNLTIKDLIIIEGHIDYSTGNVNYLKSLIIKGDVKSGFSVECGENVEIYRCVEDSTVIAAGDVIVKEGFLGMGKGLIQGNNVTVGHIKQQKIIAKGDIVVGGEVLYSYLQAGGIIKVMGVKGIVIGGVLVAGKGIEVVNAGNAQNIKTHLCVGYNSEIMELDEKIKKLLENQEKVNKTIKLFKAAGPTELLSEGKKLLLKKLSFSQNNIAEEIKSLQTMRRDKIDELIEKEKPSIKVNGTVFRNTTIQIGDYKKYITVEERNKIFIFHKDTIMDFAASSLRRGDFQEGQ
ncbi:MAG TPA: FapA family protein [archaeon]|nr:FapA family protein [archaeon]